MVGFRSLTRLVATGALLASSFIALTLGPLPATASFTDVTAAIRYDNGKVPGQILKGLWDCDDCDELVTGVSFPLNFFDRYSPDICVTTNGGIYLGDNSSGSICDNEYDESLSYLAYEASSPMIAVLALDLDPGEVLILPDGRDVDDLVIRVDEISVDGSQATVTTSGTHGYLVGDHVTFVDTGTVFDVDSPNFEITTVTATTFTFSTSVTDLDSATAGDQSTMTLSSGDREVGYSDGVGALRGVYYAETTINGEPAIIVTWYRIPNNDDDNEQFKSNTFQLVLTKNPAGPTQTGAQNTGFDFTVEFNYGTLTDDEDGYEHFDPDSSCDAWSPSWDLSTTPATPGGDNREDCRWGVGWVNWLPGIEIASVVVANGVATITTTTPHGIVGTGNEVRLWLPSDASSDVLDGDEHVATVVDSTTLRVVTSAAGHPIVSFAAGSGPMLDAADTYELFADTSIDRLIDGGDRALVANKLNSTVNGRFVFSMVGGVTQGFTVPQLGASAQPTPTPPAPLIAPPPPSSVVPSTPQPVPTADGTLPRKDPGVSQVLLDGAEVEVEIVVERNTDLVLRGEGFDLRLAGECSADCFIDTTPDGRQVLSLERAGLARVNGTGFQPDSTVYVWLFSEPQLLGELTVDSDGAFSGRVPVGNIAPGEHTLQVNGISSTGQELTANLGVVVVENAPEPLSLPATGTETGMSWVILLLAIGGILAVLGRRTRAV